MGKRILITGTAGLLGKALLETIPQGIEVFRTYFSTVPLPLPEAYRLMDVRDGAQIAQAFAWAAPDVVIHAAALGSVDYCEHHRQEAWEVNVEGTQNVGLMCQQYRTKMIYISSNAVFDGENPFYAEEAPTNPVNSYGQLKVEAERWLRTNEVEHAIVRPILMYGWHNPGERGNWVTTWIREMGQGKSVKVVDDVYSKPLFAKSCAEAIWAVILRDRSGTYHVAGANCLTLYDFALKTAKVFGLDETLIKPVASSFFPRMTTRPRDTSFDTTKMECELGVKPLTVLEGLTRMRDERC